MTARYAYRAWSKAADAEVSGVVAATSAEHARSFLHSDDLLIFDVRPERLGFGERELRLSRRRVRPQDVAWLMRQLAITEAAGLPIKRALDTILRQQEGTATGDLIADICTRLTEGEDLGTAFGAHTTELGTVTTALVAAGAVGGTMAATFEKLADMAESNVEIRRKVRGALAYPIIVGIASTALALAMLVFIVPTFKGLYSELHGRLPLPTRFLIAGSSFFRDHVLWGLAMVALLAAAYHRWRGNIAHAERIDRLRARLPVVGNLLTKAAFARVAATLASLLEAGVTTLTAIDMAADTAGLGHVGRSLRSVNAAVRNGQSLATALAHEGEWPDIMVQLVQVGEETGRVSDLLSRYAEVTEKELATEVDRVVGLIEPAMVVLIGAVIGAMVICLYLPLFNLVNLVK
ncbi:MAG: type II secretion system F family protein [Acidimicrobiales bacterium]